MKYAVLECSVGRLESDAAQAHSDRQSRRRQLTDLATTANDLRQQLSDVRNQLASIEKDVSNNSAVHLLRKCWKKATVV